jgi:hypothetical protein
MNKYICKENYVMSDSLEVAFNKGVIYDIIKERNGVYITHSNIGSHELDQEDIDKYFDNFHEKQPNALDEFIESHFKDSDRLKYIDVALRLANIQFNQELLVKVVKVVDLVNEKGGKVSVEDIVKL